MIAPSLLRALIPLMLILAVAGCRPRATVEIEPSEPLYFEPIGMGQSGALADTLETIVRDSPEWALIQKGLTPLEPFLPVDFDQMMVGLVAIPAESGGYIVEVQSVEKRDSVITVAYQIAIPGTDCISPMATALAFQAVEIRRATGPVHFERTVDRYSCSMR